MTQCTSDLFLYTFIMIRSVSIAIYNYHHVFLPLMHWWTLWVLILLIFMYNTLTTCDDWYMSLCSSLFAVTFFTPRTLHAIKNCRLQYPQRIILDMMTLLHSAHIVKDKINISVITILIKVVVGGRCDGSNFAAAPTSPNCLPVILSMIYLMCSMMFWVGLYELQTDRWDRWQRWRRKYGRRAWPGYTILFIGTVNPTILPLPHLWKCLLYCTHIVTQFVQTTRL